MKVVITRARMAMPGRFYAYDAMVSTDQLDRDAYSYFILSDGIEYVSFEDATRPGALDAMPKGWERYQASLAHKAESEAIALNIAKRAYPELFDVEKWPGLWIERASIDERCDTRIVEY